jgi:molybdate transport system regulatory protein
VKAKLKVWVVFDDKVKFGQGRAAFLRLVDELGSIKQAVERFEMSYRNAWGYLRELERAAGFRLLERQPGGGRAAGARLTAEGRKFLDRYERLVRSLEGSMARSFERVFSSPPRRSVRRAGGTSGGAAPRAARPRLARRAPR